MPFALFSYLDHKTGINCSAVLKTVSELGFLNKGIRNICFHLTYGFDVILVKSDDKPLQYQNCEKASLPNSIQAQLANKSVGCFV